MAGRVARFALAAHLILIALLCLPLPAAAFVDLVVNGQPAGGHGVSLHLGRLMLTVPVLQEHLGVTVTQEGDQLHLLMDSHHLTVRPGSADAWLDGEPVELDMPVIASEHGVMVPLRVVADVLQLKVNFDAARGVLQLSGAVEPSASHPAEAEATLQPELKRPHPDVSAVAAVSAAQDPTDFPHDIVSGDGSPFRGDITARNEADALLLATEVEARRVSLEERRQELERRRLQRMSLREKLLPRALEDVEPPWEAVASSLTAGALDGHHPGPEATDVLALETMGSGGVPAVSTATATSRTAILGPAGDGRATVFREPSAVQGAGLGSLRRIYGVEVDSSGTRQRLVLRGDGPLEWSSHLLRDPERLVIDIPAAQWIGQPMSRFFEGPIVRRIRASQYQPDSVRVVLDLHGAVRFQAEPVPQGLALTLHQQVGAVQVWDSPSGPVIDLAASGPLWGRFSVLHDPYRLVIDFPLATLVTGSREGEAPSAGITRWRISQYEPDTVRLVLELARPLTVREHRFYPARPEEPSGLGWPGYAGIYRLQLGPALTGVGVSLIPDGVALLIEGESALQAQVSRLMAPERVVVDLPGAVLPADWAPVELDGGRGVKQVRVGRNRTDLVRVVIDTQQPMRYQVHRSPDRRRLVLTLEPSAMAGTLVVLDAGHGGHDRGAIGVNGLMEADVNLELALKLGRRLQEEGARVIWTRSTDVFLPLPDRPKIANDLKADLFISIHNNSCPDDCAGSGTETFYLPSREENRILAQALQEALVQRLGLPDRGIKQRNLSVLRNAEVPAALVEVAFLSNPQEEALLRDPAFIDRAVEALVEGVRRYVADVASLPRPLEEGDPRVAGIVQRMLEDGLDAAQIVVGQGVARRPQDRSGSRPDAVAGGWTAQAESSQGEG